jgi:hypothetical protein
VLIGGERPKELAGTAAKARPPSEQGPKSGENRKAEVCLGRT